MFAIALAVVLATSSSAPPLQTTAEKSGFKKTGRYDEVVSLCRAFETRYPEQVRCATFGLTPEGRPMLALVASADGTLSPDAARAKKRTVVLAQGGIHAGEIDGKDAGFLILRELLDGTLPKELLQKVTFVFVPVLNVDGHERFGPNQRPNQRGPEEMGWRVTAQNLNLNRDYMKADAPEMQAMLRFLQAWDPILYLDLHVTDGAKFQPDVALLIQPAHVESGPLRAHGKALQDATFARLREAGHYPLEFYPSLKAEDDPSSGFSLGIGSPRFSQGYWGRRNRLGVLVETHSWRDYPHRVKTTHHVLRAFLREAAQHGEAWRTAAQQQDAQDARTRGGQVVLKWKTTGEKEVIDFPGYAYTRSPSDVSGKLWVQYDESKPEVWRIPYFRALMPDVVVEAPKGGWVVPPAWAELVSDKLTLHGFRYEVLTAPRQARLGVFTASSATFGNAPYEGRQQAQVTGEWQQQMVRVPAGALYVPAQQPGREVLVHLLEPRGTDSLLAWGYFNAAFEQKEYLEDYVVEAYAREVLARDPEVRAAFEAKLKDPAFASDPEARLRFFAQRHPAWDNQLNRYPVLRAERPLGP